MDPRGHESPEPRWLLWARELQALAQNGLHYATGDFDRQRYEAVQRIAAEMFAVQSGADTRRILDLFRQEIGHATPKVDMRGAVFRDGRILLVREKRDQLWTLPGGWADPNELPTEAIEREIREEAGYRTRAVKLAAVYDRCRQGAIPPYPYHVYKIFFVCELIDGSPVENIETDAAEFFAEGEIPALSIPRVNPRQIACLFQHHRNPGLPADFD
ncbi:MAG TPA: NUDIX hydrolase N-terminal domain-containing protein [Kiritimatiellia bacterium]|nr:NUDIX hydrolase N-terminal domain-containing protein [Kiritimatiellia bacterium]HRZ12959.1 NUDIX hydrolase N-terminal domain-containing protein [Kiritimatiellia bacterium]HSA18431.1 NUDIX hydrolase N-terminal domain-containing protein [Kiritimatiellia bacterium]